MPIAYLTYPALPPEPLLGSLLSLLTTVFDNQTRTEWLADWLGGVDPAHQGH